MTELRSRRLLLVHAHPDDETIGTGATMARYAAGGAQVTLVTCTLGEEGEVLVPALAQLAVDHADQLGGWRIHELDSAMTELGVSDHRFLGGAGRFRDSGMLGTPANEKPRAFWQADRDSSVFDTAVTALAEIVRETRPQVVVTYDDVGGYGHPDHIMAHRVTTAAVAAAADPAGAVSGEPWTVAKLYWTAVPRSVLAAEIGDPDSPFDHWAALEDVPFAVADELITTVVHAPEQWQPKARALAAHATQVTVDGRFYALSNNLGQRIVSSEYFRLTAGEPGGERDADGRETDLFGGLA